MALSSKFRLCKKGAVCPEKPFGRKFERRAFAEFSAQTFQREEGEL
jgi:hypothetical protein